MNIKQRLLIHAENKSQVVNCDEIKADDISTKQVFNNMGRLLQKKKRKPKA